MATNKDIIESTTLVISNASAFEPSLSLGDLGHSPRTGTARWLKLILPIEIWQMIFDYMELPNQIKFKQINQIINNSMRITNLFNIEEKYKLKLTDNIIKKMPF